MEKTMEKENMMGTMPEGRLLFKLAMPMIFSVLVSSLYNIVDSIFVGRIGQSALTAISLGAPVSSLMRSGAQTANSTWARKKRHAAPKW